MNWALLRPLAPVLIVAGLTALAYRQGVSGERQRLTTRHAAELARVIADLEGRRAEAERRARDAEQQHIQAMADLATEYARKEDDAQREIERLDARVRDGTVRLRERFACPGASAQRGVPPAAPGAGPGDAAQERGLRPEDAQFLVRLADDADTVTRQLQACQAVLRQDRAP